MNSKPDLLRCDQCGRFVDLTQGATRRLLTPDAHGSRETWETLCAQHAKKEAK